MDSSLLGVIIGGCIALVPSAVNAVIAIVNEKSKQKHEITLKRIEWECTAKIDAIQKYSESIGLCIAKAETPDAYHQYMTAFERLALYVSEDTYRAMLNIDDPRMINPDDSDLRKLSLLLRDEMRQASALSQKPAIYHQQKRPGKAAEQLHHFFSQCRAAFLSKPSHPSNPVKRSTDGSEHKG